MLILDRPEHFRIIDNNSYYTIENVKANDFDSYHTHLNKRGNKSSGRNKPNKPNDNICKLLIRLVCNKIVPDSDYLRESAKRISRNKRYIRDINVKIEKDNDKQKFTRVNRGPSAWR